jgi:glucose dehydrogenase
MPAIQATGRLGHWTLVTLGRRAGVACQYILMMAGGHHFMEARPGDYVIAYKLAQQGSPER